MNRRQAAPILLVLAWLQISCSGLLGPRPSASPTPPEVMADTFFSGCAYLDENSNGEIDPEEPLLGGMTFTVTLIGGGGFGDETSEERCAFITIPGGLPPGMWPVLARLEAPDDSPYDAIGPLEIELEYPDTRAEFLFAAR